MPKNDTGRMSYDLSETGFQVTRAHVTPGKIAIDWKEGGEDGGLEATSQNGTEFSGTYSYKQSRENGAVTLGLFKARDGSAVLVGYWREGVPGGQQSGLWMFQLELSEAKGTKTNDKAARKRK